MAVRHRQKDWADALAAASDLKGNLADVVRRERAARAALEQQLAERQAQYEIDLARAEAVRAMIDEQIQEAALAVERARHAEASTVAELSRERTLAAERLATYQQRIEQETAARRAAEETLASAQMAHADAEKRHESALSDAAVALAERETELTAIAGSRDSLEQQLQDVQAKLTQETESRTALEQALTDLRSTAAAAEQRFRGEIEAITENACAERARLEDQMSRERHDHQIQLTVEQEQHRRALTTAAARLAEQEAQFKTERSSITATRDSLVRQVRDVQARLKQESRFREERERSITELRSAAAAAEQRFREQIATLTENARAEQVRLDDQMSRERRDHETQLAIEQEQHRSALAVAATRLAEREAHFKTELASLADSRDALERQLQDVEAKLTQETESRTTLAQVVTEVRATAAAAERRLRDELGALTENARAEHARLEDQMSRERHDHQIQLTDEQEQHRSALAVAATRLAEREAQFATELASVAGRRDNLEQQLQDVEARLTQETESRTALEQALSDLRSTAAAAEQRFHDEIATITENASTERARLEEQLSNQRAQFADRLAERGAEFEAELKRLSEDNANASARLRASIAERDSRLEERAKASAALRHQLDASEDENRRQFEEAPVPLIRCTRDLGVAGANRAFAALVECRAHGELRDQSVVALFESRDDLIWLIERSVNSGKTESVETTCIRKDGTRIAVRLSARACASGLVEIAAEDLTMVRVLEDRLREARRMESVGRLASEIAVTCEKLLSDVYRDAQRLLTTMTGAEAPQRSETLLDEVTRVGSFLHQLVAYGQEQSAALAPVDLNRVLRHLEPVLRQVAGDSVTLELQKASSPVNVDVNAERVERLLVNVASYGRERMPYGGRLRIELSTVVVDGKFIAQYPNVRQGPHALITVTEAPRSIAEGSVSDRASRADARGVSERPGVDLSALQELISECGGHLWITAEPGGSMVVKMRLPLRAPWEGQANRQARHGLGRVTARLLGR